MYIIKFNGFSLGKENQKNIKVVTVYKIIKNNNYLL